MEVIPAIDLRRGRCVRLYQGDYSRETVFSGDPVGVAQYWQSLGAQRLHIVDLDGAAKGELCHAALVEEIARSVDMPVQLGGGLRRLDLVEQVLSAGVARAILGTAALEETVLMEEACRRFGEGIIVSVDVRGGFVASHGWRERTMVTVADLVERMAGLGVKRFVYTDIARDGTLTEPNYRAIADLLGTTELPVIAAGGISSVEHLRKLAELGVEGAIVGRALYTGDIDLAEALSCIQA